MRIRTSQLRDGDIVWLDPRTPVLVVNAAVEYDPEVGRPIEFKAEDKVYLESWPVACSYTKHEDEWEVDRAEEPKKKKAKPSKRRS